MIHLSLCGYNTHNANYDVIDRPNGSGDYLFLYFIAPMKVTLNHHTTLTKPNACILYSPNASQYYGNVEIFYNSFLHFEVEEEYLSQFHIPTNTIFYPKHYTAINQYIQQILNQSITKEPLYELAIHSLITELLITVSRDINVPHHKGVTSEHILDVMKSVRIQILTDYSKNWTLPEMANLANLSVSRFHYYYKYYFHTSPKADLLETRLNQVQFLLTDQTISIKEAARLTGFEDMPHFTRLFSSKTGMTPTKYRLEFLGIEGVHKA